jgi:hypothetical protein
MDLDKFLNEMQKLITASQQGNLFGDKAILTKTGAAACVEFLKGKGYGVTKPHEYPIEITKLDELIATFYGFIRNIYQTQMGPYHNDKKDRAIAKRFVEGRMEDAGLDRKTALKQCGLIVRTVFTHSDVFKFDVAPTFSIFGQANMGWITDRAVQLINKQIAKDEATATERAANKMTESIEKNYTMGYSLEELAACQKKLEEQYGKEENQA